MPHTGYNIPGQRRAYSSDGSSCRAISDNSSGNDSQEDSDKQKIDRPESPVCQNEADMTLIDSDEGMDTIKRVIKPREPVRPPRIIDGQQPLPPPSSSIEYYNLCNPPPVQEENRLNPAPTIPRRKPYISNSDFDKKVQIAQQNQNIRQDQHVSCSQTNSLRAPSMTSNWSERTCQPRSRCTSRGSTGETSTAGRNLKKKYLSRRRKGSTCHCKHTGTGATEKQDSVILMYSRYCNGSIEWAKYLHKLFTELSRHKGKLTVKHLPVEDMTCLLPAKLESEIYNARLQLVIVSPLFLQWVYKNPNQLVGRLLQQDRVIALLLGVREEQVLAEHRSSLISFPQWVHLEARDHDLEFVQTVLYFSTQILQRTEARLPVTAESLFFTLFPRKVTENQNKVVIMFDKPLNARSTLRVVIEKTNGQKMAVDDIKLKNPFTLMVTFPVCLFAKSCLVNLYLEIDGESKGFRQLKCESKTHELDSLLASLCDPMEFLCQTLSISPHCKDQLDETLTNNLMSNIPKHGFPLLSFPPEKEACEFQSKENCEFPTLLHFSSAHGLEQLTCALLDCPGAKQAVAIRNVHDLAPSDVAKENGFFDLAEILKAHQHNPSNFSHIYDYIKHGRLDPPKDMSTIRSNLTFFHSERPVSNISEISDYSGPDPYQADSAYKVPPPPRPIPATPTKPHSAYLDMSGSNSGTPSPCQQRRYTNDKFQNRNLRNKPKDLTDLFQNLHTRKINNPPIVTNLTLQDNRASTMSKYNLDSSYQEIRDPQMRNDPFGTMRASKARRSLKEKTPPTMFGNEAGKERLYVNDPFGTMRASRANSVPKSMSSDASNDDVFSPPEESTQKTNRTDYRGIPNDASSDNLAVTEELLELLEDFKQKSYTVKEMEILFENWRRKASLPENIKDAPEKKSSKSDLLKASKSAYSLLKLFRGNTSDNNPKIKRTSSTKKFLKPSSTEISSDLQASDNAEHKTFHPPLDESQLSVVALPPTPLKPETTEEGVSSQILPLHRLSGSSLPNTSRISNTSLQQSAQQTMIRQKPIAEVSPFSNFKNTEVAMNSPQLDETYAAYQGDMPFVPNNSMMDASTTTIVTSNTPNNTLVNTTIRTVPTNMQHSQGSRVTLTESDKEASPSEQTADTSSRPQTTEPKPTGVQRQAVSETLETDSTGITLRRQISMEDPNKSPVKEKLQKMRRSITEPLMQYFHDMTMTSPELEEPDILNTPKSLLPTAEENSRRLSRKLFGPREMPKRHSARTSQVHEYQNISPTPSTDL